MNLQDVWEHHKHTDCTTFGLLIYYRDSSLQYHARLSLPTEFILAVYLLSCKNCIIYSLNLFDTFQCRIGLTCFSECT